MKRDCMEMYILRLAEIALYCILCLLQAHNALADPINVTTASTGVSKDVLTDIGSDAYFSAGTCYFQAESEADLSYLPCGNAAFGTFACCEAESYCLENNACWSRGNLLIQSISNFTANCSEDGTTYVSGCTDSSYSDPACPNKGLFGGKSGQLRKS